jgi:ABC-2 type transport system permease protein
MNTLQITTSFKKEIWEYEKTLLWVPAIVAAMMLAIPAIQFMLLEDYQYTRIFDQLAELQDIQSHKYLDQGLQALVLGLFMPFVLIALVLQVQYFISCLFDERRDLSAYFWRSMPVSDAQSVIVKLLHGALVIPAIFMLAATATLVFILILAFIACIVLSVGYDIALWGLWGSADILTTVAAQWINIIPYAIWMFPVFAWLMLASMFANKVPFLWATLPVVIIILVEAFVVQHFSLSHSVISQTLRDYFNFVIRFEPGDIRDIQSVGFYMTKKLFSKVEFGASLLGCGFVYLAYLLRAKRN